MELIQINSSTIGGDVKQTVKLGTIDILNNIIYRSYKEDPDEVYRDFNNIKNDLDSGYEYLYDAVFTHLVWAKSCKRTRERHIQDEFFGNIGKYLPGATKVDVKRNKLLMPDGFVKIGEDILPVEVKRDAVVNATVVQIMEYIKEYRSVGGIVVAPLLKAPLPSNVVFVQVGGGK